MANKIYDLVIAGAGVSGLTAAVQLAEKSGNAMKILIVEASDRVGGRIRSERLANGATIELGAQWFHGGNDNTFYQWAHARYPKISGFVMDTTKGRRVVWDRANPEKTFSETHEFLEKEYRAHVARNPLQDISFYNLARNVGTADAMEVAQFMSREYMATGGAPFVSAIDYFEDPNGPGGWQLKGGLSQITNAMADEARSRGVEIRLSQSVKSIFPNPAKGGEGSHVLLENGDTVVAKKVLVTASSGVIRSGSIGFEPAVRRFAEQMASGINMANLWKVIMPLSGAFEKAVRTDERHYLVKEAHFVQGKPAGNPVVTLFAGGHEARALDSLSDDKLIEKVESSFAKIPSLEKLRGHLQVAARSNWANDKNFYGTYSNLLPGEVRYDPFSPDETGIWFAGDGFTTKKTGGSIAGAFESGASAAEAIFRETSFALKKTSSSAIRPSISS